MAARFASIEPQTNRPPAAQEVAVSADVAVTTKEVAWAATKAIRPIEATVSAP
jgi:hypothetical protein